MSTEGSQRVHEVNAQRASLEFPREVICECAQPACLELIAMNAVEYRGLRSHSTWFVIAPREEHFFPEVERIVAEDGHYWVVSRRRRAGRRANARLPGTRRRRPRLPMASSP